MPAPPGASCATCAAYEPSDSTCHYNSPIAQSAGGKVFFPQVLTTDWCIDWLSPEALQQILKGRRKP